MNGLFITGTDTGVGKTFVTTAIARHWRRQQRRFAVSKPVASGAQLINGHWRNADTLILAEAAGWSHVLDLVTPFSFPEPLAPASAARLRQITLTLADIVDAVHAVGCGQDAVLVEGAGGILCPLTNHETMAELAVALQLPVVIVARLALGTVNHTLLTLEAAHSRCLNVAGVVVNATQPLLEPLVAESSIHELEQRMNVPLLGVILFQPGIPIPEVMTKIDWWQIAVGAT